MDRTVVVAASILLALLAAAPAVGRSEPAPRDAPARTGTARVDFTPGEWTDVGLAVDGVSVDRVKLHPAGRMTSLVLAHDEANRGKILITNSTGYRISPSVAIAVFDDEGRLLAAANTGIRLRAVNPGQTREYEIHFGGVFRHIAEGRLLYVSLEY